MFLFLTACATTGCCCWFAPGLCQVEKIGRKKSPLNRWCLVVPGGAWWCLVVPGGAWWWPWLKYMLYLFDKWLTLDETNPAYEKPHH